MENKEIERGEMNYTWFAVFFVFAVIFFAGYRFLNRGTASVAVVSVNGQTLQELPLDQDADLIIEGVNGERIIWLSAMGPFQSQRPPVLTRFVSMKGQSVRKAKRSPVFQIKS